MAEAASEKTRVLSFAEQQMLRHGWQPGKGLGRHEDGMSEPIKVKVKSDKGGVGHKLSDQFTFNWWDHVFNKASSNLSVESGQDGIVMKKIGSEEEDGMVSNKRPLKAKLAKGMQYGCFVKSATLLSGEEMPEQRGSGSDDGSDSEDDDEKLDLSSANNLSDAQLLKICGGRTAHKGARHGLTMSAKLARLEQQEQEFMAKYGKKTTTPASSAAPSPSPAPSPASASHSPDEGDGIDKDVATKKTKRKKEKKRRVEAEVEVEVQDDDDVKGDGKESPPDIPDEEGKKERKKKKKRRSKQEVDAGAGDATPVENQETDDSQSKKKKKKKKCHQEANENGCEEDVTTASTKEPLACQFLSTNGDCEKPSKKKRSKKGLANGLDSAVNGHADVANSCDVDSEVMAARMAEDDVDPETCIDSKKVKKKKKKKKSEALEDVGTQHQEGDAQNEDLQVPGPDVVMDGEVRSAARKSKGKKRKAAGLDQNECNDADMNVKKRKKGKQER